MAYKVVLANSRYIYIPLGGSQYYALSIFPIFTFVALWHDIQLKMLMWGWLVPLFILPELLAKRIFCTSSMRAYFGNFHLHLCALGAVLNLFMMMTANLVGFAVGVDGVLEMINGMYSSGGIVFILWVSVGLFAGVHVMFYLAAQEAASKKSSTKIDY